MASNPVEKGSLEGFADTITCVCGNTTSDEGFGNCTVDGVFVPLSAGPAAEGLIDAPREEQFWVCHSCGRLYNTVALEDNLDATVAGRINLDDPAIDASRRAYWEHGM